jgi:hypothetical protein
MIMIRHPHIGMNAHAEAFVHFAEQLQQMETIPVIGENRPSFIASRGDVLPSPGEINAERTCQSGLETTRAAEPPST